jgi:thymidine phosphorylase
MDVLVQSAKAKALTSDEISLIATGLASSGTSIKHSYPTFDVASTGGPSSLSTLLCPLVLRHFNMPVLKLGVPGRPAGGIDVLAQLKDYNISPTLRQIKKWFREHKYVHFISNDTFAPLDAALFSFRKRRTAINIPQLAMASLLSKKIAVGLSIVGLDVRAWKHGNFGCSIEETRRNATLFNQVARQNGIKSICFITNLEGPLQPYIGRGEALLALHMLFSGNGKESLLTHLSDCVNMAMLTGGLPNKEISHISLRDCFIENIEVQGSSEGNFLSYVAFIYEGHKLILHSPADGFLNVDLVSIRDAVVSIQNSVSTGTFPDPCGVILLRTTNDFVQKDEPLCTIRCIPSHIEIFKTTIMSALVIAKEPVQMKSTRNMEVID